MDIIEPTRHLTIFDPAVWGDRRIDVIGLGATGNTTAQLIGRLGVTNLHLHDDDTIGAHNLANQLSYTQAMIGFSKAEHCRDSLMAATGIEPVIHGKCEGPAPTPDEELGEVVFLCLDSMSSRAAVVNDRLRHNNVTELVIDPRMGVDEFRLYAFNPNRGAEVSKWLETITPDTETQENACQIRTTLGGTAAIVAGLAKTWFLQWYRREIAKDSGYQPLPFEVMVMLRPLMINIR